IERIEHEIGIPGLAALLAERLTPTDLQSLLLDVYRQRAQRLTPADVLSSYESNRFVKPSTVAPQRLLEWEQAAFAALPPEFRAVTLAPVCPLGTNSAVAAVDQNWSLVTIRNSEVISDSSNVLALECARERRALLRKNPKSKDVVQRAASHRLLRTQNYDPDNPRMVPHFSVFTLCSAGQYQGALRFELAALRQHIGFYVRALQTFLGLPLRVALTDFGTEDHRALLTEQLVAPLQDEFPGVDCAFDDDRETGRGYYDHVCFHVYAAEAPGEWLELADGGVVNWTQRLLNNAKERCVISGIGSERVCMMG
ncbi:MAG TPA: hypothetical protein VHP83_03290, partial [Aggregatilineaceae bacterium]|nr:hypothetical protein [Aggregatilineaceae bacterium]